RSKRAVIERRERRPLPARRDIGEAKARDGINTGQRGQQRAVTDLHGETVRRIVKDGLAVKADHINLTGGNARVGKEAVDEIGLQFGEFINERRWRGSPAEQATELFAKLGRIGER